MYFYPFKRSSITNKFVARIATEPIYINYGLINCFVVGRAREFVETTQFEGIKSDVKNKILCYFI